MTPLWESKRRGFPQRFGKACWLFHISAQGPVADEPLTINQRRGSLLLDQGGSVLRCQNETAKRPLSEPPQSVGQQRTAKARKKLGSIGANHLMVETTVKFDLGQLLITPGALDALTRNGTDEGPYLLRHQSGDWGDVDEIDKRENDFSLLERFRLMSAYHLNDQTKIWGHNRARP